MKSLVIANTGSQGKSPAYLMSFYNKFTCLVDQEDQ